MTDGARAGGLESTSVTYFEGEGYNPFMKMDGTNLASSSWDVVARHARRLGVKLLLSHLRQIATDPQVQVHEHRHVRGILDELEAQARLYERTNST